MNQSRLLELQQKHRPEKFRPSFCKECYTTISTFFDHVCNPERLSEAQQLREYWADPIKENRKKVQQEVRTLLNSFIGQTITPQLLVEIVIVVTPHLSIDQDRAIG